MTDDTTEKEKYKNMKRTAESSMRWIRRRKQHGHYNISRTC